MTLWMNYFFLFQIMKTIMPYDQLVQEGILLDAATAVEDVRQRDEAADQEHPVVDLVTLE